MTNVMDFIRAALPWIAIGLFVAVNAVLMGSRKSKNDTLKGISKMNYVTATCFAFVALMEFADGDTSSAITFMVIGIASFLIGIGNNRNSSNKNMEENKEEK